MDIESIVIFFLRTYPIDGIVWNRVVLVCSILCHQHYHCEGLRRGWSWVWFALTGQMIITRRRSFSERARHVTIIFLHLVPDLVSACLGLVCFAAELLDFFDHWGKCTGTRLHRSHPCLSQPDSFPAGTGSIRRLLCRCLSPSTSPYCHLHQVQTRELA